MEDQSAEEILEEMIKECEEEGDIEGGCYQQVRTIIDSSWENTEESVLELRHKLFKNGKPSVMEFLKKMLQMVRDDKKEKDS